MSRPDSATNNAPTPPRIATHYRPIRWLLRGLRWLGWAVLAAWSLVLLTWLTLHWIILPHIDRWREPIEQRASALLGQRVQVGEVIVTSGRWVPALELRDVTVFDAQSQPALRLPRVVAALSARSLLSLEPRFSQLLIDNAELDVVRDANGRIYVAGIDFSGPERGDRSVANWFFKLQEFVIRRGSVRWTDALHPGGTLALSDVQVVIRNSLRHHDLRIDATPPEGWGDRFTAVGLFTQPLMAQAADWQRWRGRTHVNLPYADIRQLGRHVDLPVPLERGEGAVRAWVDFADGAAIATTIDVAARDVRLPLRQDAEPLILSALSGRLQGRRDDQGGELAAKGLAFTLGDGMQWPAADLSVNWRQRPGQPVTGGQVQAERIDLALVTQLLRRLPVGAEVSPWVDQLDPRGSVDALKIRWDGLLTAPASTSASAGAPTPGEVASMSPRVASAASAAASGTLSPAPAGWRLPAKYQLQANLRNFGVESEAATPPVRTGRPGISGADVQLSADERGGTAQLALAQGEIDLPGVFEESRVPLDRLRADIAWQVEAPPAGAGPGAMPHIALQIKDASFANADAAGELRGRWATQREARTGNVPKGNADMRFPGVIDLEGKLSRGVGTRVARYLPLGVRIDAREYVDHAVRGGRITSAAFKVKGLLDEFPFADAKSVKSGEFRFTTRIEDATLAFIPSWPATVTEPAWVSPWPAITELNGELVFDRLSMEIRGATGRLQGVKLTGVQGRIDDLELDPLLKIEGAARGAAVDVLRFVNATPVGSWIGGALAQTTATGSADLKLALAVPLAHSDASTVRGSVTLAGSDLRLHADGPTLAAARGQVDFTQKSFSIAGASGRLLGGDVAIDGGVQPDGSMRFIAQGTATAEALRRGEVGGVALSRLAGSLSGQSAYRAVINVVRGRSDLTVTSNLVGMASDLPAPLRKAAEMPLVLRYQNGPVAEAGASPGTARDQLRVDLGGVVQAHYVRDVSGDVARVLRGGIGVGEAAPLPARGVAAALNLATVDLDAWQQVADRATGAPPAPGASATAAATTPSDSVAAAAWLGGYLPTTVNLRAQELQFGTRRLNRLVAAMALDGATWRATVDADQISGAIDYRPPAPASSASAAAPGGAGRVYARLKRLSIPKDDVTGVDALLDQPASSVPALDVVVEDFELRGKRLGRLELEAVNRQVNDGRTDPRETVREWRLNKLALTTPEAKLSASGNWAASGATTAGAPSGTRRVVLNFKLELGDSGALLERLGFGKVVRGGKGEMSGQIAWFGSPMAMDYPSLSGKLNAAIASGQFLKAEPGMARLLGVLSLQALPRRLILDFRDVFQEGFAFDDISGDLTMAQGVAQTNNLRMRGVQAAVLMEGSADVARETQDLRVVVVPEINAGTASLAYAAINPAIGLGTFLAQALLRGPLVEAGTREFRVSGSWDDPKVERIERQPAGAAAAASAASTGRPALGALPATGLPAPVPPASIAAPNATTPSLPAAQEQR
jgi:uncharacterized protein (TIGR02099 family)